MPATYPARPPMEDRLVRARRRAPFTSAGRLVRASLIAAVGGAAVAVGDKADERYAAEFIREAAPESVDVWVVAGAGHSAGLRTQPAEWTDRATRFLDAALLSLR